MPGNLGYTIIKRSYLLFEIILLFMALADILQRIDARWSVVTDRPYIISILVLLGLCALLTIVWMFVLAFCNINLTQKNKEFVFTWRPVLCFALSLTAGILIQKNNMHILFAVANVTTWACSAVHLYRIFRETDFAKLCQ